MADAEKLLALAERVERAVQPDREIDCLIRCALSGRPNWRALNMGDGFGWGIFYETTAGHARFFSDVPMYTASLDAAMTLVPDRWSSGYTDRRATVEGSKVNAQLWQVAEGSTVNGYADTPALALTAACLRARARGEE